MAIKTGIEEMVPIRITFGGADTAYDFRKILKGSSEVAGFRVFGSELPADLKKEAEDLFKKIGAYAEENNKKAVIGELKDTLQIYTAREDLHKGIPEYKAVVDQIKAKIKERGLGSIKGGN